MAAMKAESTVVMMVASKAGELGENWVVQSEAVRAVTRVVLRVDEKAALLASKSAALKVVLKVVLKAVSKE